MGTLNGTYVGDKGYDLGTQFAITGSATIAPGWSGGYNITVNTQGTKFATGGTALGFPVSGISNQFGEGGFGPTGLGGFTSYGAISTLYSYMYVKSDRWGTLNWGHLSPASDNKVVLADISGTVIESNSVFFEGASFILRPKGANIKGYGGLEQRSDLGRLPALPGPRRWSGHGLLRRGAASRTLEFTDLGRLLVPDVLWHARGSKSEPL